MEVLSYKNVKARKEHICDWCGSKISVGDKYNKESINDSVYIWKIHLSCKWLANEFDEYNEGLSVSEFEDCVFDNYVEIKGNGTPPYPPFLEQLKDVKEAYNLID